MTRSPCIWVVATSVTAPRWQRAMEDASIPAVALPWGRAVPGPDCEAVEAMLRTHDGGWVVATSAAALRFLSPDAGAGRHIACVGPHTANAATQQGFVVGLLGNDGGAALARQLVAGVGPKRALVLRSPQGRDDVETLLRASGWVVDSKNTYAIDPDDTFGAHVAQAPAPTVVVHGSPRAARAVQIALGARNDVDFESLSHVAAGETTAQALRDEGCVHVAVADHPTPPALVAAVQHVAFPQEL